MKQKDKKQKKFEIIKRKESLLLGKYLCRLFIKGKLGKIVKLI
jgi:hypothetical protein